MSFIASLQRQRNNSAATPVALPQRPVAGAAPEGLASTFRDPNRFNTPVTKQFSTTEPTLARQQLLFGYRG